MVRLDGYTTVPLTRSPTTCARSLHTDIRLRGRGSEERATARSRRPGEPAVRVLSAAGELTDPVTGERLRTIAVSTVPRAGGLVGPRGDETLVIEARPGGVVEVPDLVAALVAARRRRGLARARALRRPGRARRGVRRGRHPRPRPRSGSHPRVLHPDRPGRRRVGGRGRPPGPTGAFPEAPDGSRSTPCGTPSEPVALGLREVTVLRDTWAILAELPATGCPTRPPRRWRRQRAHSWSTRHTAAVRWSTSRSSATATFAVTSVDTDGRVTHSLVEEPTGAGFLGLRLRAALGERLPTRHLRPGRAGRSRRGCSPTTPTAATHRPGAASRC